MERSEARRSERGLLHLSGLLAGLAVVLPFSKVGDMLRPDQRLLLPALLLAVAALPFRTWSFRRALVVALTLAAMVLIHTQEYRRASSALQELERTARNVITPFQNVVWMELCPPTFGSGCFPNTTPSLGISPSDWIGALWLLEEGGIRINLMPTSLLIRRDDGELDQLQAARVSSDELHDLPEEIATYDGEYHYVVLHGCPHDVRVAEDHLRSAFSARHVSEGYAILERKRSEPSTVEDALDAKDSSF
jgi:hypothetical protein